MFWGGGKRMSFDDYQKSDGAMCMHNDFNRKIYEAGAQSRQAEVDELNRKITMYEKHVNAIKFIHENQFDENSDTSWILGNLDGFFGLLESDLKKVQK